jgi:hypothetical protein
MGLALSLVSNIFDEVQQHVTQKLKTSNHRGIVFVVEDLQLLAQAIGELSKVPTKGNPQQNNSRTRLQILANVVTTEDLFNEVNILTGAVRLSTWLVTCHTLIQLIREVEKWLKTLEGLHNPPSYGNRQQQVAPQTQVVVLDRDSAPKHPVFHPEESVMTSVVSLLGLDDVEQGSVSLATGNNLCTELQNRQPDINLGLGSHASLRPPDAQWYSLCVSGDIQRGGMGAPPKDPTEILPLKWLTVVVVTAPKEIAATWNEGWDRFGSKCGFKWLLERYSDFAAAAAAAASENRSKATGLPVLWKMVAEAYHFWRAGMVPEEIPVEADRAVTAINTYAAHTHPSPT